MIVARKLAEEQEHDDGDEHEGLEPGSGSGPRIVSLTKVVES